MTNNAWTRRDLFGVAALVALQGAVPGGGMALLRSLDPRDAPSARQRRLMLTVADHVIPPTQTPGAGAVGAGDFAIIALAHGLDGARQPVAQADMPMLQPFIRSDSSLDHVRWLEHRLGQGWPTLPHAKRHALLAALDTSAFANDPAARPWRMIKGLILTGYYTSEVGGSQELQYELVPGRFDPKVPLAPGARAFSSDWTAVDFG